MSSNLIPDNLDTHHAALLVIDMEKAFVEPGAALCIAGAKRTVPVLAETIAEARRLGVRIIWVKRIYAADGSDMEAPRWRDLVARGYETAGVLAPDSVGLNSIEEPEGLVRDENDMVIIKPRFSAFFGTNLKSVLDEAGIDTILLTGTTTPNCIRSTCYDAISHDYRVIVMEACCSSVSDEVQATNILDMERIGAEIFRGRIKEE